jgi:hypothetical protein
MLENTEGAIKNGQSGETGNIDEDKQIKTNNAIEQLFLSINYYVMQVLQVPIVQRKFLYTKCNDEFKINI